MRLPYALGKEKDRFDLYSGRTLIRNKEVQKWFVRQAGIGMNSVWLSLDKLRAHESAVKFTKDFMESGKPVSAICYAGQLLVSADMIRGQEMTGWKSIVQDIKNAGAEFIKYLLSITNNFMILIMDFSAPVLITLILISF